MIKKGDIILFKSSGHWIEECISKVTNSPFVHVGIVSKVSKDFIHIHEALNQGVVESIRPKKDVYYSIEENQMVVKRATEKLINIDLYINKYEGKSYGFVQLLLIAIKRYTGITLWENGLRDMICSEYVARVLMESSKGKIKFRKPDYVTPAMLNRSKYLTKI